MAYTLFIDSDKKQVSGSAITATSTRVNGGTSIALGTSVPSGALTANRQLGNSATVFASQVLKSMSVFSAFQGTGVVATSVASGVGGYAAFTKNSHGLAVGNVLSISGSTTGNLDGIHIITAKNTNTFTTNRLYVASATAGTYALAAGRFASMTAGEYVMTGYSSSIASGQATRVGYGSDYGIRRSIHKLEAMRTTRTAKAIRDGYWNVFEGVFTTAPTSANDIANFGTDHAATPSRAVPGELTYRVSGMPDGTYGPKQDNYAATVN